MKCSSGLAVPQFHSCCPRVTKWQLPRGAWPLPTDGRETKCTSTTSSNQKQGRREAQRPNAHWQSSHSQILSPASLPRASLQMTRRMAGRSVAFSSACTPLSIGCTMNGIAAAVQ